MVMEAPPNPQCVGREFVRQYYTLLNKAPAHLHRFYNNNSSFVHGGLDAPNREIKPMVGQRQIHQRIQQLNFRDCHAKISQVDSQATLGDGVVVQVTGELSNGGQPMRRFTQTFVLAAQSPKKYYVHNDIFRYQDMMSDEDAEHDSGRSDGEEDSEPVELPVQPSSQQPPSQAQPYYPPPLPQQHQIISSGPAQMMNPTVNGIVHVEELAAISTPSVPQAPAPSQAAAPTQPPPPAATAVSQPVAPQTAVLVPPQPQPALEESQETQEEHGDDAEEGLDSQADIEPTPSTEQVDTQSVPEEKSDTALLDASEEPTSETVTNEPKTYANLLKGSGHSATSPTSNSSSKIVPTSPPPAQQRVDQTGPGPVSGPPLSGMPSRPGMTRTVRGGSSSVRGVGRPFTSDRQGSNRPLNSDDSDGDRRRSGVTGSNSAYPDSNQLFLGNLPHHATDDELKELFSQFGAVADLRIHSKPNVKSGPGSKVPNYGFITFEDPSSVKNVLEQRPVMFNGQKLNVEEKKPRRPDALGGGGGPRSGPGSDSGQMGRSNNGLGGNGGGRGGQPGAMSRGAGSGARGRGASGNFSRGDGAGGQGGARGGSMSNNSRGGGFAGRR